MPVSSYLTISPVTDGSAGILSVALVVIPVKECPDVIRLAALRCSDFPLLRIAQQRSPDVLHYKAEKL